MRNNIFRLVAFFMLGISLVTPAQARELPKPELMAVYFYADWCPKCKALSPKLDEARKTSNLDKENILFVKLDLTNKASIHQSILLAQALGIGDFVQQQGSATGYVAVLDAATKQELTRFDAESSSKQIEDGLKSRLKGAPAQK